MADDGFYIGYRDRASPGHARRMRRVAAALVGGAVAAAALLASQQAPFVPSVFEFGTETELMGWIREQPVPALVVAAPGDAERPLALSSYLLVGFGKHGAQEAVAGLHGQHVRVRGTLIHLDGEAMIELTNEGAIAPLEATGAAPEEDRERIGRVTLRGEIVDSKCHFGVMNPGTGKVHRACAARCLSGGVPPVFLVRTADGGRLHLLLVGTDGRSIGPEVLDVVAEPLEITGEVERIDSLLVLRAEPDTFARIP